MHDSLLTELAMIGNGYHTFLDEHAMLEEAKRTFDVVRERRRDPFSDALLNVRACNLRHTGLSLKCFLYLGCWEMFKGILGDPIGGQNLDILLLLEVLVVPVVSGADLDLASEALRRISMERLDKPLIDIIGYFVAVLGLL